MISRFYTPPPLPDLNATFALADGVFHHAIIVLRLRVGDPIVLFDGAGHAVRVRLSRVDKKSAQAVCEQSQSNATESMLNITLAQCLSSSDKMDWTIEKAVELGVRRIVPLFSHKSNIKLSPERAAKKIEHWQRIINAACGQCERNVLPILDAPMPINAFLKQPSGAYKIALHPNAATPFKGLIPPAIDQEIILLIGPESGLDEAEINAAISAGYTTTLLGPRILRTESAGLAAISALQAVWGDF